MRRRSGRLGLVWSRTPGVANEAASWSAGRPAPAPPAKRAPALPTRLDLRNLPAAATALRAASLRGGSRSADLMFVLDCTQSMNAEIEVLKEAIISFAASINKDGVRACVGLIEFQTADRRGASGRHVRRPGFRSGCGGLPGRGQQAARRGRWRHPREQPRRRDARDAPALRPGVERGSSCSSRTRRRTYRIERRAAWTRSRRP